MKKSLKKHEQSLDKTEYMNESNMEGTRNPLSEHDEAPEVDETELNEWIAKAAEAQVE